MSDLSQLQSAIARNLDRRVHKILITRGNELHCQIERGAAPRLAGLLRAQFHAELILMVANDRRADKGVFEMHYLFANARENWFLHATEELAPEEPIISLATFYYPASRFEREIQDLFGIQAIGHPDPRPLVRHAFWPKDYFPLRKDAVPPEHFEDDGTPFPFKPVGGEGVYEIPVGPVHAGVIEPGHFRFSVIGETVIDLKIRLYFTHKGTEKLFEGRLPGDGVELAERISGDTTIGHSLAYCQALESLSGTEVPSRARYLRVILLEMERLYNHIADFGAIANDTGFAIAHAHCSRLRERLLRLNKLLTGNRLLRGGVVPGGVRFDLPDGLDLPAELYSILSDFNEVVDISLKNTILIDRLEGTGCLTKQTAVDHGTLGYVARASGVDIDIRRDHPFATYDELDFQVPVRESGDVYARTMMRVDEAAQSVALIRQAFKRLAPGPLAAPLGPLPAFEPAFGIVEGWRGAIIHWIMVDDEGKLYRVKIKDPSFVNWPALSFALLKNIVPDFPLCNKSFNLSYSGNDL
ncbi:MAG TPA: NADH-quinone oxidoreductase subunit C [Pyrinomonadaceae bacterium]|nr:NADH-quinone oxidoreductase subunit C [Pyrinomonadaceae bacterium]